MTIVLADNLLRNVNGFCQFVSVGAPGACLGKKVSQTLSLTLNSAPEMKKLEFPVLEQLNRQLK